MRTLLSLLSAILLTLTARSQDFNYTVTSGAASWQELNSQTILNSSNTAWNFSYRIPIGFSFGYLGQNFDSLTIETNGYLVFDEDRSYAFTAFTGFGDRIEAGDHAVLGYELSGTAGNKILKIQFKNVGIAIDDPRAFSYQVWLKENGDVLEVHTGPNDFQVELLTVDTVALEPLEVDTTYSTLDSSIAVRIGLINMNMDTEVNGVFVGGAPSSPGSQPANTNNPEPVYLHVVPASGIRYTFTPN